jgi:hypothetical protein
MGVAAARRSRVSGSIRQPYRLAGDPRGAASRRTIGIARLSMAPEWAKWIPARRKTFSDRVQDDGELIGLKTVLLATLLLLTALLEWVA